MMEKIFDIKPVYVDQTPPLNEMKAGCLYISKRAETAIHLCACGCRKETVTPLDQWNLTDNNGVVTLRPSIGNWRWESPYHAHYFITNNKIEWCN